MTRSDLIENVRLSLTIPKGRLYKRPDFGHRFNELTNAPADEDTRRKAEGYGAEAVRWMLDAKRALNIDSVAFYDEFNRLIVRIQLEVSTGAPITFDRFVEVADAQ